MQMIPLLSSSSNWKTISSLNQTLSDDLAVIERWARGNKMYVNRQKTKALLVMGKHLWRRMDQDSGKLEVVTGTAEIEQVVSHKPLGLIIDDELCNKLPERNGLLRHISPYLKEN